MLQLLDSLAEVCHPLDDSEPRWHRVASPALGDDAWGMGDGGWGMGDGGGREHIDQYASTERALN